MSECEWRTLTLPTGWSAVAEASSVSIDTDASYVALEKASAGTPRLAVSRTYTGAVVLATVLETVDVGDSSVRTPHTLADSIRTMK